MKTKFEKETEQKQNPDIWWGCFCLLTSKKEKTEETQLPRHNKMEWVGCTSMTQPQSVPEKLFIQGLLIGFKFSFVNGTLSEEKD